MIDIIKDYLEISAYFCLASFFLITICRYDNYFKQKEVTREKKKDVFREVSTDLWSVQAMVVKFFGVLAVLTAIFKLVQNMI